MSILYRNKHSINARGGTELIAQALESKIPSELLEDVQIFVSRIEEPLDPTKIRIYWAHDLAGDPATEHLSNDGWKKFHKLVFVSNWQMQSYIARYNIPWSHCIVLHNAIEPIEDHVKPKAGQTRLAYWSTPHRGLDILVPVFTKLAEEYDVILDVYSSFNLYGWTDRDEPYEPLFEACRQHPNINYHGAVPNNLIRENLKNTHILAYPNTWAETSCMVLMEAMSAKLLCVHPNYAALPETAANWTNSYQYIEDKNQHASMFYSVLKSSIEQYDQDNIQSMLNLQKMYADLFYSWTGRQAQWIQLIESLKHLPRELPSSRNCGVDNSGTFVYSS